MPPLGHAGGRFIVLVATKHGPDVDAGCYERGVADSLTRCPACIGSTKKEEACSGSDLWRLSLPWRRS